MPSYLYKLQNNTFSLKRDALYRISKFTFAQIECVAITVKYVLYTVNVNLSLPPPWNVQIGPFTSGLKKHDFCVLIFQCE